MTDAEQSILGALSASGKMRQINRELPKEPEPTTRNVFWLCFTLLFLVAFASIVGYLFVNKAGTYTHGAVHWQALINISICGESRDLPRVDGGALAGTRYRGTPLIHTYDDNTLHVEGLVYAKEDISLGTFFDALGVPFDSNKLFEYTTPDSCPNGTSGTLHMYVNGQPRTDYRDYIPAATLDAQQQVITLIYG